MKIEFFSGLVLSSSIEDFFCLQLFADKEAWLGMQLYFYSKLNKFPLYIFLCRFRFTDAK
jgi:hypothetical protein